MDLQSNFSHTLHSHLYGSSGFSIEDCMNELIHNSFDANANCINLELINGKYLLITDDGYGNEDPCRFFGLGSKLIKKERNKIGKKNIGFLGTVGTLEPEKIMIFTLKKGDENIKSLLHKTGEHIQRIHKIDELKDDERDFKKIQISDLFVNGIEGSWKKFFKENNDVISDKSRKIYNRILENESSGTLILFEIKSSKYILLDEIFYSKNECKFMKKITIMAKKIDIVSFCCNNVVIQKDNYRDILDSKYQSLFGNYTFSINNDIYLCEENIKVNQHIIITNYIKINITSNIQKNITKSDYIKLSKTTKKLGAIEIGYQLWDKIDWNELDFGTHDEMRHIIYDCFDGEYRFIAKSLKEATKSTNRNSGPYLSFIKIDESNIEFAEKYLGIANNKTSSSIDTFDKNISRILIDRFRKKLIDNFSNYTIYTKFKEYIDTNHIKGYSNDIYSRGITNWLDYEEFIKKIFTDTNEKLNYLIWKHELNKSNIIEKNNNQTLDIIDKVKNLKTKESSPKVSSPKKVSTNIEPKITKATIKALPNVIIKPDNSSDSKKTRKSFPEKVVEQLKQTKGDLCHITHIPNTIATPTQKDHKDGNRENNSIDNLNIINISLHYIKTTKPEEYKKIISSEENIREYMVNMLKSICSSDKMTTYLIEKNQFDIKTKIDAL